MSIHVSDVVDQTDRLPRKWCSNGYEHRPTPAVLGGNIAQDVSDSYLNAPSEY